MSSSTPNQPSQDDWIRVTSRDGFSFIAKRSVVFRSGTLRNMLDERRTSPLQVLLLISCVHPDATSHPADSFAEATQKVCPVDERYLQALSFSRLRFLVPLTVSLRAAVTEKFVEFLAYKATYENVQPNEDIPDFSERIAPEIALELCVV